MALTAKMMADPAKMVEAQISQSRAYTDLWQNAANQMLGAAGAAIVPDADEHRFRDDDWRVSPVFDFIKHSYLLTSRWISQTVREFDGLDEQVARKVEFNIRQFVDALAPTNYVVTNPKVLRATVKSGGENLVRGLENLLTDLDRGKGKLHIQMTGQDAFEVGGNIAVTFGKVVYQSALLQLIQYTPTTEKAHRRPLLIMAPWINKFYILDLRPKNSFKKGWLSRAIPCSRSPGSTRTRAWLRNRSRITCSKDRSLPSTP